LHPCALHRLWGLAGVNAVVAIRPAEPHAVVAALEIDPMA
jgi:hypothetical protein